MLLVKLFLLLGISAVFVSARNKIIGGNVVTDRTKFNYQALIKFDDSDLSFCGGVIISSDLILTAAHCFDIPYKWIEVIVGNLRLNGDVNADTYYVRRVIIHEKYDIQTASDDIALLKLSTHMSFNSNVDKITLNNQNIFEGSTCVVSGWGVYDNFEFVSSNTLRAVEVKIVDTETCNISHKYRVKDGMLCAGEPGKDSCVNDSGGPLVCDGVLVGLVSWGSKVCGDPRAPGVYTNVSYYAPWIATARSAANSSYLGFFTILLLICLMLVGV